MGERHLEAQKHLEIKDVVLRTSIVSVRDDVDVLTNDFSDVVPQFLRDPGDIDEMEVESTDDAERFWVYKFTYKVGVRLIADDEVDQVNSESYVPAVLIMATFESRYFSDIKINEKAVKDFSINNVGFNIWPYWREIVQSSSARIGLPHCIQVPLYRMNKPDADEPEAAQQS